MWSCLLLCCRCSVLVPIELSWEDKERIGISAPRPPAPAVPALPPNRTRAAPPRARRRQQRARPPPHTRQSRRPAQSPRPPPSIIPPPPPPPHVYLTQSLEARRSRAAASVRPRNTPSQSRFVSAGPWMHPSTARARHSATHLHIHLAIPSTTVRPARRPHLPSVD